jgi:hypothetical protein
MSVPSWQLEPPLVTHVKQSSSIVGSLQLSGFVLDPEPDPEPDPDPDPDPDPQSLGQFVMFSPDSQTPS